MITIRNVSMVMSLLAGGLGMAPDASATALDATGLINTYNAIVFNNVTSTSHVDGSTLVGGEVKGGTYGQNVNLANTALTVGKSLSGSVDLNAAGLIVGGNIATSGLNANRGGNIYVGGNITSGFNANFNGFGSLYVVGSVTNGTVNANGGSAYIGGTIYSGAGVRTNGGGSLLVGSSLPSAQIPNVAAEISAARAALTAYSGQLSKLATDSTISNKNGTLTFTATPGADGVAVFSINGADLLNNSKQIDFSLNGAKEAVINVSGIGANSLTLGANFIGGSAQKLGTNTVWNFTDAQNINIKNQFGGTILAVLANISTSQNIEGTVIANNLNQNGEIHYNGQNTNMVSAVPLPAALPLFGAAILGLGALGYRKRSSDAA
ncbi:collagen-binding domain-containing protein [Magnetospirillum fulvum]|nr:collagen-binding domain-containing protein [Magnetospirillum fulvum]